MSEAMMNTQVTEYLHNQNLVTAEEIKQRKIELVEKVAPMCK